ncbi:MAG: FHA domain-containing protein [Planctomycetes bacterium]|nr:FHA domain-containing protein [Planctomycetota bacterium]
MPRFQLLVRELGKAPRTVALAQTLVVGRSRRADLVLEDEEVGREQFRIGPSGAGVVVEGIGSTNKTIVDGNVLDPGQKVTIGVGVSIKVGRCIVQVQAADATEGMPAQPGSFDATLVAGRPNLAAMPEVPPQERTDNLQRPGRTSGPTRSPNKEPTADELGQTMNAPAAFRPGAPAPAKPTPPKPAADDGNWGQTIDVRGGGFRPGAPDKSPPVPPAAKQPPAADANWGQTIDVRAGGFRPGQAVPPTPPAAPAKPATPAPSPAPAPAPAEPAAAAPPPTAAAKSADRPKTVLLPMEPAKPAASQVTPVVAVDVEAKLHQALPRVVVKGETVKRRVRLMKAKCKLGRAETADVLLPHESVSELHAEIAFDGASFQLRDCGSTNGTLVDGSVVRNQTQAIRRNSLLGFGSLRGLFVCIDPATLASDRRHEERALRLLVKAGRLGKDVGAQVLAMAKADTSQTIGEVLLLETPLEPADWASAIVAVRSRRSLWERLAGMFGRKRP